jgi:hypothetical protein
MFTMPFKEELQSLADRMESSRPHCTDAIQKALMKFMQRYENGEFEGYSVWSEIAEDFIDEVDRTCPKNVRPYRSGKRSSK